MELIRGWHNLRPRHRGCVATLGNFDGVHRGHQAVLQQLSQKARELKLPATVIVFEPQPREHFQGAAGVPARLTRLREKILALRQQPVDRVLCLRFDEKLAALPAESFIDEILVAGLGIRYVVVGDDFRFGARRKGDIALLRQHGQQHGFEAAPMHSVMVGGERVSSTRIRDALARGDLAQAEKLLGRPYCMCGRVAHGDKLVRTLGVPTANLHLHRLATPLHGIYVVRASGRDIGTVSGVASIGHRPAVNGERTLLEVHLFDFNREIYGHYLQIDFLHKLRDERNFDSLDALKHAMQTDMNQARAWFAQHTVHRSGQAAGHH